MTSASASRWAREAAVQRSCWDEDPPVPLRAAVSTLLGLEPSSETPLTSWAWTLVCTSYTHLTRPRACPWPWGTPLSTPCHTNRLLAPALGKWGTVSWGGGRPPPASPKHSVWSPAGMASGGRPGLAHAHGHSAVCMPF